MTKKTALYTPWLFVTLGAAIGALASFIQIIERISFADNPLQALSCDVNSVFSCSSVFDGWQSSFFGFPNAIMSLLFFGILVGIGLAGLFGSVVAKGLRLTMHFFSVFFLFFGAWYLQQSAFVISALCLFCIFLYIGVITVNWAWLRINIDDLPVISTKTRATIKKSFTNGTDTFLWILWGMAIAGMFVLAFR